MILSEILLSITIRGFYIVLNLCVWELGMTCCQPGVIPQKRLIFFVEEQLQTLAPSKAEEAEAGGATPRKP